MENKEPSNKKKDIDACCNLAYLFLGAALLVHFVPFERMGWTVAEKYCHGLALALSCFMIVAIGIRELVVFFKGVRADERILRTVATLRLVLMLALCVLLWKTACNFYPDVAVFPFYV